MLHVMKTSHRLSNVVVKKVRGSYLTELSFVNGIIHVQVHCTSLNMSLFYFLVYFCYVTPMSLLMFFFMKFNIMYQGKVSILHFCKSQMDTLRSISRFSGEIVIVAKIYI